MIEYTVHNNGDKIWRLNGQLHREDGPAVEYANGTKQWYINGKYHREDGPAIEFANGTKQWWLTGQLHREDGPAVEWAYGYKTWYLHSKRYTKEEFLKQTQPAEELTIAEIEQLLGFSIKIVK